MGGEFASDRAPLQYHYTDRTGAMAIHEEKGELWASAAGGKDAVFGAGVYCSSRSPFSCSRATVAANNYFDLLKDLGVDANLLRGAIDERLGSKEEEKLEKQIRSSAEGQVLW